MMKKILLLLFLSPYLHAEELASSWGCIAHDDSGREWVGASTYQRSALSLAVLACKKESLAPYSCKTSKEECSAIEGNSTRPLWRCVAYDQMAREWESNLYSLRDDAAVAARSYCQDQSNFPDTCYTNLMTCKNVNLLD